MRALVLVAVLAACKDKQESKPAQQAPPPSAPAAGSATARPSLPAPDPNRPQEPVTLDDATKVLPPIEGNVVLALKQTSDSRQVHGTWCIDGTSADDVAKDLGHRMAKVGYSDLSIRGDARKAGVTGNRLGLRLSIVVSASAAAVCKAPAHYFASATIFRP